MRKKKKLPLLWLTLLFVSVVAFARGLQDTDFKTRQELEAGGETLSSLLHSDKIYVNTLGLNEQLTFTLTQGDILTALLPWRGLQVAVTTSPQAGSDKLYFKSDDALYRLTSGGSESLIGPVTGGPFLPLTGGSMSGGITMTTNRITGLSDPVGAQDAATKSYVDRTQNFKDASKYATTVALPANSYSNGASGVGATLTGLLVGALIVDGNTPSVGDRILVKNEAAQENNGIYVVTTVGSGIALYVLTRAADFDLASDLQPGDSTFILAGTSNALSTWALTTTGAITMGVTALTFAQVAGPSSFSIGAIDSQLPTANGLTLSGTTLYAQSASPSAPGFINTALQSFTGAKGFNTSVTTPVLGLLGATSGRITMTAAATTTNYAITWPATQGAASANLQNDGTGVLTWAAAAASPSDNLITKSSAYTAAPNDVILADTSGGAFSIASFAAAGNANKYFCVKKITSDLNAVTVTFADLVDGDATFIFPYFNSAACFKSNGSSFYAF